MKGSEIFGFHLGKTLELGHVFSILGFIVLAFSLCFVFYLIFLNRENIKNRLLLALSNPKEVFANFYHAHLSRPLKFGAVAAAIMLLILLFARIPV
jgi:hypothetical protein